MDTKAEAPLLSRPASSLPLGGVKNSCVIEVDGAHVEAVAGERLIDALNRDGAARNRKEVPQVCYHPHLGPIQTCDTCIVEIDGQLGRACGTMVADGMSVLTASSTANDAQREAFDRILGNHLLYCTVCDNNNGNDGNNNGRGGNGNGNGNNNGNNGN